MLGSAMSVQAAMEEMERQQKQGTLGEDELEALAKDVTSKVRRPLSRPPPSRRSSFLLTTHSRLAACRTTPSQILLVTWRSTKFEVIQVLSDVVDAALKKEDGVTDEQLALRAKVRRLAPPRARSRSRRGAD